MAAAKQPKARKGVSGVRGVKQGGAKVTPPRPKVAPLRRYPLARMAKTEPPKPDFVIGQLAARGEIGLLWGRHGLGKSLLAEAACAAVSKGDEVIDLPCTKGKVCYVDAENGEYEVHRRVRSVGLSPKNIVIYDAQRSVHIVTHDKQFRSMLEHEQPDLLVLDSLRRLTPGSEENDSGVMAEVVSGVKAWAQEFDLAVLLVHHARKDGTAFRGSSAIEDQVSIAHEMSRDSTPGADRNLRRLHCLKMRIAKEPDDLWFRINPVGDRLLVEAADEPEPLPVSGTARVDVAAEILAALAGAPLSRPQIATALGRDKKDQTLRRAVDELAEAGRIEQMDDKKWRRCQSPAPGDDTLTPDDSQRGAGTVASGDSKATRRANP
jgi:hypothetical protein